MFNDTYHDALEFKEQRDELFKMLKGVVIDIEQNERVSADTFNSAKSLISKIEGDSNEI
jgi:hypothetical protein